MKALKEKRNSIRSLWRMGLVILSVFVLALALVACGDSSTGTPVDPPVSNGNNGSGGNGTEPPVTEPPVETPKTIKHVTLVSPVSSSAYSHEGQKPDLAGLTVDIIWSDDSVSEKVAVKGSEFFGTTPAILGKEQIGTISGGQVATPVTIDVYPRSDSSKTFSVELPGVQALVAAARTTKNSYARGTRITAATAIGLTATTEASFADISFGGITIYEDEFKAPPTVAGGGIKVKYKALWKAGSDPDLDTIANVDANRIYAATPTDEWETITLTSDHIFYDYYTDFLTSPYTPSGNSATPYLPYGIDLKYEEVAFLISRGLAGEHGGTPNESIFIIVPFNRTTFYYVRDIIVQSYDFTAFTSDADGTKYKDFAIQSDLIALGSRAAWDKMLADSKIKFNVYYNDPSTAGNTAANTINLRDDSYFSKAVANSVAGVVNFNNTPPIRIPTPVVSASDDDNFGKVAIGYYTSLLDNGTNINTAPPRDPASYGDFSNLDYVDFPIAVYQEGSAELRLKKNAIHNLDVHDGKLLLVAEPTARNISGSKITQQQFTAINNTYELVGTFVYEPKAGQAGSTTTVVKKLVDLQPQWFSALTTSEYDENYELSLNVSRLTGGEGNLFNGAEATVLVKLLPINVDGDGYTP